MYVCLTNLITLTSQHTSRPHYSDADGRAHRAPRARAECRVPNSLRGSKVHSCKTCKNSEQAKPVHCKLLTPHQSLGPGASRIADTSKFETALAEGDGQLVPARHARRWSRLQPGRVVSRALARESHSVSTSRP